MKEIKAFEAIDGTKFFTEHECVNHEWVKEGELFEAWYSPNDDFDIPANLLLSWLQAHAEDIRGFLPPVETAKPEINIKDLDYKVLSSRSYSGLFNVEDVEKWLAGEIK